MTPGRTKLLRTRDVDARDRLDRFDERDVERDRLVGEDDDAGLRGREVPVLLGPQRVRVGRERDESKLAGRIGDAVANCEGASTVTVTPAIGAFVVESRTVPRTVPVVPAPAGRIPAGRDQGDGQARGQETVGHGSLRSDERDLPYSTVRLLGLLC